MQIPFRHELDEILCSGRSIWLKLFICATVTSFGVIEVLLESDFGPQGKLKLSATWIWVIGAASACLGAMIGLALLLKDTVGRRIERGSPVNPLLRILFGKGKTSLAIWFVSTMIAVFVLTIIGTAMGIL